MGPILAGMLSDLVTYLQSHHHPRDATVLFCARGGLVLRRAVELVAERLGSDLRLRREDFMISRVAAARVAIQRDPTRVSSAIETEMAGRTLRMAALAMTGVAAGDDPRWDAPFTLARFVELLRHEATVSSALHDQADLLRRYIERLRGDSTHLLLCDTGVFGSTGLYLRVGIPRLEWRASLLFRANYKRIDAPHFAFTDGVVSTCDMYVPWRAHTTALLYWPLIEWLFEPDLPSVRHYQLGEAGGVVSNLEIPNWQYFLAPAADSMLAGAWVHLSSLSPDSLPSIPGRARAAWQELRRMIVYPSRDDVALLATGRRGLDFGTDEMVSFTPASATISGGVREKMKSAFGSMWPEGELRKQFPRTAGAMLVSLEAARFFRAVSRPRSQRG